LTKVKEASFAAPDNAHEKTREQMIAEAAYYRAERRGFASGRELEDWLAAEADVALAMTARTVQTPELH
jgi:hypothetical protein